MPKNRLTDTKMGMTDPKVQQLESRLAEHDQAHQSFIDELDLLVGDYGKTTDGSVACQITDGIKRMREKLAMARKLIEEAKSLMAYCEPWNERADQFLKETSNE